MKKNRNESKKFTGRRILSVFLSLQLVLDGVLGGMPGTLMTVNANEPQDPVAYIDHIVNGNTATEIPQSCNEYTVITESSTSLEDGGWYVVNSDISIDSRVTVSGTVNLILCDGATLIVPKGITVEYADADGDEKNDNIFNIYGQSGGSGKINAGKADPANQSTGIGSNDFYNGDCGDINIHGGTINAIGVYRGAGIGGYNQGKAGNITIYGGTITAMADLGAAIGSGDSGDGGNVTIYGGTVTANGCWGAGIGGGYSGDDVKVTIYGGTVTATSVNNDNGCDGAGIGGGNRGNGGDVTIYGGNVTATGGYRGAGIGGGEAGTGGNVTIYGGTVTASGGEYGAGIGGGKNGAGGNVSIYGGTVTASGSHYGAGIGGGSGKPGGNVTIYDGKVTASSETGAGIGGGADENDGTDGTGGTVTIYGGEVTAGANYGAGIGGGRLCNAGDPNNKDKVVIYGGTVSANSVLGAGIGGGETANGGDVFVHGGTVFAQSVEGAGIGGGQENYENEESGKGGHVIVYGGLIKAKGCDHGEGIGGSEYRGGTGSIELNNDELTIMYASSSNENPENDPDNICTAATRERYMTVVHTHDYQYSLSENKAAIKCKCIAYKCTSRLYGSELILSKPAKTVYGDGKDAAAVVTDRDDVKGDADVVYYRLNEAGTEKIGEALTTAPENAGKYRAEITLGYVTAYVVYDIAKVAAPALTNGQKPVAKTGLVHSVSSQELVCAPAEELDDYTLNYSIDGGTSWSTEIPAATAAGTYTVKVKYVNNSGNYEDIAGEDLSVTISKKETSDPEEVQEPADVQKPSAKTGLVYSGTAQPLVTSPAEDLSIKYAKGTDDKSIPSEDAFTAEIPTGTDAGVYYVWYKTGADTGCITAEIKKAESEVKTAPKAVSTLYMTGRMQEMITAGEAEGGKFVYSLTSGSAYSEEIPSAKLAGEYTVYYKILGDANHNDSKEFSLKVVIKTSPASPLISVSANTMELYMVKGEKFYMPQTGWAVKYKGDKKYVSIDAKGLITAKKATAAGGVDIENADRIITVYVAQPEMKEKKHSMKVGESWSVPFKYDIGNYTVHWYSGDQDVARVDDNGTVTAVGAGKIKVYAVIKGVRYSCSISVKENKDANIERTLHMNIGKPKNVSIKGVKIVSLNSADPNTVSVDKKKLKGEAVGETTVTVYAKDGKTYILHVFVEDPTIVSDSIKAGNKKDTYTLTLNRGEMAEINYKGLYQAVNYDNTKPYVAYESGYGVIVAGSAGTTKISAKVNGKKISINVTVTDK